MIWIVLASLLGALLWSYRKGESSGENQEAIQNTEHRLRGLEALLRDAHDVNEIRRRIESLPPNDRRRLLYERYSRPGVHQEGFQRPVSPDRTDPPAS